MVYTLDTLGTRKVNMETRWTPRGQNRWMWYLPWGQPSVVMTWMVDWMVEMTFPIVEWSYHVTSMKESNVIL